MIKIKFLIVVVIPIIIGCSNPKDYSKEPAENSHPLEKMAEDLINKENSFFSDQKISDNFWVISESAGTVESGTYPQVESLNPTESHKLRYNEMPQDSVNLGIYTLNEGAKLTDFLSCAALAADGFLISKKAKAVLEQYNLGNSKYFSATIVKNTDSLEYFWLHLVTDQSTNINYDSSTFYIQRGLVDPDQEAVKIRSLTEFRKKSQELMDEWLNKGGQHLSLKIKEIYLKDSFDRTLDIFGFAKMNLELYISKRLREAIKDNGLTGMDIDNTRKVHLIKTGANNGEHEEPL
jgi:hypothetical protein